MALDLRFRHFITASLLCSWWCSHASATPTDGPYSVDYPRYQVVSEATVRPRARNPVQLRHSWQTNPDIKGVENLRGGYVIVLCGVLGKTEYNAELVRQLEGAGYGVELYDWTSGVPLPFRRGLTTNRFSQQTTRRLRRRIEDYQLLYPDAPVYLIGLCAGAGPVCEVLRHLEPDQRVTRAVLLGAALSPIYDLRPALRGTEEGIDSFHSPLDVPILVGLTTLVGTVDGQHLPAAGAIGFGDTPNLRQHRYGPTMLRQGHWGGHFGWTARDFVQKSIFPLLKVR